MNKYNNMSKEELIDVICDLENNKKKEIEENKISMNDTFQFYFPDINMTDIRDQVNIPIYEPEYCVNWSNKYNIDEFKINNGDIRAIMKTLMQLHLGLDIYQLSIKVNDKDVINTFNYKNDFTKQMIDYCVYQTLRDKNRLFQMFFRDNINQISIISGLRKANEGYVKAVFTIETIEKRLKNDCVYSVQFYADYVYINKHKNTKKVNTKHYQILHAKWL